MGSDNQLQELRAVAKRMGWRVAAEYVDHGISGAKGRDQRPAYDQLYNAVVRREVDLVMAWSVDRLGRSLQQLVVLLSDLQAKGVDLYLHQQGIGTDQIRVIRLYTCNTALGSKLDAWNDKGIPKRTDGRG